MGFDSLHDVTASSQNTAIGTSAGNSISTGGNTNTVIGYGAGSNITTGDNNIILGGAIDAMSATGNNQLNIGDVIYGTSIHNTSYAIGLDQPAPNEGKLEVKGGTVCVDTDSNDTATSCIANESDVRLKKNIKDLGYSLGTLMKLRPVAFDWRINDPEVMKHYDLINRFEDQPHSIGFIAQDIQKIIPEIIDQETVGDGEVQYMQLDYAKLTPVVVKAVQELKGQHDGLAKQVEQAFDTAQATQHENKALKEELAALKSTLASVEEDIKGLKTKTGYGVGKASASDLMIAAFAFAISALFFFLGGALRKRNAKP